MSSSSSALPSRVESQSIYPIDSLLFFEKILEIMNDCNGLKMAKEKALLLYLQAKNNLEVFEDNIYKNHLITILDYSLNRIS